MTTRDTRPGLRAHTRASGARRGRLPGGLSGIRWIPVPLALLAALVGWLVFGTVLGQSAAAQADRRQHLEAGGLRLSVQQLEWMSNDMTGQGPVSATPDVPVDPAETTAPGFSMPDAMMPGMQPSGDDRLQLEVTLANITSKVQRYQMSDFRLVGPGGQSWPELSTAGQNTYANQASIEPNYSVTVDVYFDVPMTQTKGLSIEWSRGGDRVDLPVNPSAAPMTMP